MSNKSESQFRQSVTNADHTYQSDELDQLSLGQTVDYIEQYQPNLLQPVSRKLGRDAIGLTEVLPFHGEDIWNGYEFSWLNHRGKPQVALLQCKVPVTSPNLIESKSFKLYLNSFNHTRWQRHADVEAALIKDLSECAGKEVSINLFLIDQAEEAHRIQQLDANCIDDLDIEVETYHPDATLLRTYDDVVEETLCSHLLKSNCLITGQPDWGSVVIRYKGPRINREQLLKFIISFRQHNEFHEQCVERIFCAISHYCQPEQLTVMARYTRRGGLDINPFRSNFESPYHNIRLLRQ